MCPPSLAHQPGTLIGKGNMQSQELLNDKTLARRLDLSTSWVRKQRWLRRKGEDHVLNIDPVMIGDSPRYRAEDIEEWLETLGGCND